MLELLKQLLETAEPEHIEDVLRAPWASSDMSRLSLEEVNFITKYIGRDNRYIEVSPYFFQNELKYFFGLNPKSRCIETFNEGPDQLDVCQLNGINVILDWEDKKIIRILVNAENQKKLAEEYIQWKENYEKTRSPLDISAFFD